MENLSLLRFVGGLLGLAWAAAVEIHAASTVQAISLADASLPVASGGNSDSSGSAISSEGRFVLFLSSANNLVTNDDGGRFVDVFLRDGTNGVTTLVSVNQKGVGGGNGNSVSPTISTNGRYVVFESEASNLVANDTNGVSDVFMRDLQTGTTTLVSMNSAGAGGNGASTSPLISSDGRYVAFVSEASDLVPNDTNGVSDVFVRDLQPGTTTLVSVSAEGGTAGSGSSASPVITPDGRWVAFVSKATNLVAGVTNDQGEIYARDLVSNTTLWVTTNVASMVIALTSNVYYRVSSYNPALASDGNTIAFKVAVVSPTGRNVPTYRGLLILCHNLENGRTDLVSTNATGNPVGFSDESGPVITPDGRYIAYAALSGGNLPYPYWAYTAVYLWDARDGTETLVSANLSGTISSNAFADTPAVSADGRFVTFVSDASDLVTNAVDESYQVYLRDTVNGTTRLVSVDPNGDASGQKDGAIPTISADGCYIAFDSFDGGSVADDNNNNAYDVFLRGMTTDITERVSRANAAAKSHTANNLSSLSDHSVSADGRFVAFVSLADNLTANDTNDYQDVFVRDLQAGTNILVSVNRAGGGSANGFSGSPAMSADGRYVAFVGNAADLTANKTNRIDDIFVRDLQAGTSALVSVSADGATSGNAESSSPQISSDGRYVAFYSKAKNLVPNDQTATGGIFWRDVQSGSTVSVTTNGSASALFSLSADGRYIAAASVFPAGQLFVWDAQARAEVYSTLLAAVTSGFILSPDGRTLIFPSATNTDHPIIAQDLVSDTDRTIGYCWISDGPKAQVSGNGRFVTFVSAANAPNTPNGTNNVFLYDLQTATTTLVSFNRDRTGSGDGPSDSPSISADGRFVTYRSAATDLVAGNNNKETDVFLFDRLAGTNTLISVNQTGDVPGNDRSGTPIIGDDGSTVVFKSAASDLVGGDLNSNLDVFLFRVPDVALLDSDGDGMADTFEKFYFGDLSHNGSGDSDGDGATDWMESKTGTDPMDPASRFSPQAAVSPGKVTITWRSVPGQSYRVQYKDDLSQTNWSNLVGGVMVNGSSAVCSDTWAGTNNQRFYRVILVE